MKRTQLSRYAPLESQSELRRTALNRSPKAGSLAHDRTKRGNAPKRPTARDTGPTAKVVALVWRRDEGCCVSCGRQCVFADRSTGWSVQHRRARGMGGTRQPDANQPQNLIVLCGSATTGCHGWVESHREAALLNGWAVKSNSDPLREPVLHWLYGVTYLHEDGSITPTTKED